MSNHLGRGTNLLQATFVQYGNAIAESQGFKNIMGDKHNCLAELLLWRKNLLL